MRKGRVVALHRMPAEPPRRPDESPFDYERRLPVYPSRAPAQFAIELAGGRLAQLGVGVGAQLGVRHPGSRGARPLSPGEPRRAPENL